MKTHRIVCNPINPDSDLPVRYVEVELKDGEALMPFHIHEAFLGPLTDDERHMLSEGRSDDVLADQSARLAEYSFEVMTDNGEPIQYASMEEEDMPTAYPPA